MGVDVYQAYEVNLETVKLFSVLRRIGVVEFGLSHPSSLDPNPKWWIHYD